MGNGCTTCNSAAATQTEDDYSRRISQRPVPAPRRDVVFPFERRQSDPMYRSLFSSEPPARAQAEHRKSVVVEAINNSKNELEYKCKSHRKASAMPNSNNEIPNEISSLRQIPDGCEVTVVLETMESIDNTNTKKASSSTIDKTPANERFKPDVDATDRKSNDAKVVSSVKIDEADGDGAVSIASITSCNSQVDEQGQRFVVSTNLPDDPRNSIDSMILKNGAGNLVDNVIASVMVRQAEMDQFDRFRPNNNNMNCHMTMSSHSVGHSDSHDSCSLVNQLAEITAEPGVKSSMLVLAGQGPSTHSLERVSSRYGNYANPNTMSRNISMDSDINDYINVKKDDALINQLVDAENTTEHQKNLSDNPCSGISLTNTVSSSSLIRAAIAQIEEGRATPFISNAIKDKEIDTENTKAEETEESIFITDEECNNTAIEPVSNSLDISDGDEKRINSVASSVIDMQLKELVSNSLDGSYTDEIRQQHSTTSSIVDMQAKDLVGSTLNRLMNDLNNMSHLEES